MNRCVIATVLSALMVCFALGDVHGVSEQSGGTYKVDANWARLPAGTTWNGNTTWITADGRGQVVVLVRTAPYFRVLSRDGAWVKAFGDDGLFESAHSVTIDAQGYLWVTDSAAHVVQKFSSDGRVLMTWERRASPATTRRTICSTSRIMSRCAERRHLRVRRICERTGRALLQGRRSSFGSSAA